MSEATDRFASLARDLLHLEITLIKHPFVDRVKAPDPKTQLVDLAESYRAEININREMAREVGTQMASLEMASVSPALESLEEPPPVQPQNLQSSFAGIIDACEADINALRSLKTSPAAHAGLEALEVGPLMSSEPPLGASAHMTRPVATVQSSGLEALASNTGRTPKVLEEQEQKMKRILENSRQIQAILNEMGQRNAASGLESLPAGDGLEAAQWAPENIMQIRKLWEVRPSDVILMRTVIGMDGDVIAHVNPDYAGPDYTYLHTLHDQSVKVSVDFWKELIGILSDFISTLVDRFPFR